MQLCFEASGSSDGGGGGGVEDGEILPASTLSAARVAQSSLCSRVFCGGDRYIFDLPASLCGMHGTKGRLAGLRLWFSQSVSPFLEEVVVLPMQR